MGAQLMLPFAAEILPLAHGSREGCCMVLDWPGKDAQGELLHNLKVWHDLGSLLLHSLLMTPVLQESN